MDTTELNPLSSPVVVLLHLWEGLDIPEGWRAEIVAGALCLTPLRTDRHNHIIATVQKQVFEEQFRDDSRIAGASIHQVVDARVPTIGDLYVPDLLVLPGRLLTRSTNHTAADALLVVEVTSPETAERDRSAKRRGYAHAPVPLYLLVDHWDPVSGQPAVTLFSEPRDGVYTQVVKASFGTPVKLPEPFGFTLETGDFPRSVAT